MKMSRYENTGRYENRATAAAAAPRTTGIDFEREKKRITARDLFFAFFGRAL